MTLHFYLVCFYLIAFNQITDMEAIEHFASKIQYWAMFAHVFLENMGATTKLASNHSEMNPFSTVWSWLSSPRLMMSLHEMIPRKKMFGSPNAADSFTTFFLKRSGSKHQFDVNSFRRKQDFSREKLSLGCKLNNIVRPFSLQSQALPAENRNKIVSSFDYSRRGNKKLALKLVTISAIIFTASVCSG